MAVARRTARFSAGFTLVEVMVALVLISILAGMIMTAVNGVTRQANLSRTQSIISIVDSVLQEQYESYKYRPLPVAIPDLAGFTPDGQVFGLEILPSEAARVRLNMMRDLQRMEMPDRMSDIVFFDGNNKLMNRPATIFAAASPVIRDDSTNPPRMRRDSQLSSRRTVRVEWFGSGNNPNDVPNRFSTYFQRALPTWTPQHEGAECLYLILSSSFIGGRSAIEMVPAGNIGDTDGDGMLEILDGYGRPLEFIRWPSGYHLADTERSLDNTIPDDFDLFRSDFGYFAGQGPWNENPWSMRPLVVSAGRSGQFGLSLRPDGPGFRYNNNSPAALQLMSWPITTDAMGPESQGRSGTYIFVDPYMRSLGVAARPGSPIPGQQAVRDDNITNYALAVE